MRMGRRLRNEIEDRPRLVRVVGIPIHQREIAAAIVDQHRRRPPVKQASQHQVDIVVAVDVARRKRKPSERSR